MMNKMKMGFGAALLAVFGATYALATGPTTTFGGVGLESNVTAPISTGKAGLWRTGNTLKFRKTDGTDQTVGGVTAHSALTGLTTGDDHTQYALLVGRSGGQVLYTTPNVVTQGHLQLSDNGGTNGDGVDLVAGDGVNGGDLTFRAGSGSVNGGALTIASGNGGTTSGNIVIQSGNTGTNGNITLSSGTGSIVLDGPVSANSLTAVQLAATGDLSVAGTANVSALKVTTVEGGVTTHNIYGDDDDINLVNIGVKATGSIHAVASTGYVSGEIITLDDGVNPPTTLTFGVDISLSSASLNTMAARIRNAINTAASLDITAGGSSTVTLTNDTYGAYNADVTSTVANPSFVVTGMSGGINARGVYVYGTQFHSTAPGQFDSTVNVDGDLTVAASKTLFTPSISGNAGSGGDLFVEAPGGILYVGVSATTEIKFGYGQGFGSGVPLITATTNEFVISRDAGNFTGALTVNGPTTLTDLTVGASTDGGPYTGALNVTGAATFGTSASVGTGLYVAKSGTITTTTYYANASTGSDSNDCSVGSPCLTFEHVMDLIPVESYDQRYLVSLTGAFTLSQYVFKHYHSNIVADSNVAAVGSTFTAKALRGFLTIYSEPTLLETVTSGDITGTATDAVNSLVVYTCAGKSWTTNAYKGHFLIDSDGDVVQVASNTATTITVMGTTSTAAATFRIYDYGASITATNTTSTLLFYGKSSPISFIGIDVENASTGLAVQAQDSSRVVFQGAKLDGINYRNVTDVNGATSFATYFQGVYIPTAFTLNQTYADVRNSFLEPVGASIIGHNRIFSTFLIPVSGTINLGSSNTTSTFATSGSLINGPVTMTAGVNNLSMLTTRYLGRWDAGSQNSPGQGFIGGFINSCSFDANGTDTNIRIFQAGMLTLTSNTFTNATGACLNVGGGSLGIQMSGNTGTCSTHGLRARDGVRIKSTTGGTNNSILGTTADISIGNVGTFTSSWANFYASAPIGSLSDYADGTIVAADGQGSPFIRPLRDNEGQVGTTALRWANMYSVLYNGNTLANGSSSITLATDLAAFTGTSNIVTLGTISSGTWSATTIAVNKGGTGNTSYTDGQLLIGNTSGNTLTKATLTAGSGISITNGNGSITIDATGSGITALTGDVTASGSGSVVATIANSAVTLAKMANIADQTILGNNTGGSAAPVALTVAQTNAVLNSPLSTSGYSTAKTFLGTSGVDTVTTIAGNSNGGSADATKTLRLAARTTSGGSIVDLSYTQVIVDARDILYMGSGGSVSSSSYGIASTGTAARLSSHSQNYVDVGLTNAGVVVVSSLGSTTWGNSSGTMYYHGRDGIAFTVNGNAGTGKQGTDVAYISNNTTEARWGSSAESGKASPGDFAFYGANPRGGTDTNTAGSTLTLSGGKSTGTGDGGNLIFSHIGAGSTGTTLNTTLTTIATVTKDGITIAANKGETAASGTGAFDYSAASGVFKTSTGANTLSGDVTLASGKSITAAGGASAFDYSAASGTFKTPTGLFTYGGNLVPASGKVVQIGGAFLNVTGSGTSIPACTSLVNLSSSGSTYTISQIGDGPSDADCQMLLSANSISGAITIGNFLHRDGAFPSTTKLNVSGAWVLAYWSAVQVKWYFASSSYPGGGALASPANGGIGF